MAHAQLVYIVGDVHGNWEALNDFLDENIRRSEQTADLLRNFPSLEIILLQTGDFGYWPHHHGQVERRGRIWNQYGIDNTMPQLQGGLIQIYWCDGNHENHDALDLLKISNPGKAFVEIMPGVNYAPFGATLELLHGVTVLFCGGAESTDKWMRVPGLSWWEQEVISEKDMRRLPPAHNTRVDWVISHTCPTLFSLGKLRSLADKNSDPSKPFLDRVLLDYRPKRWWFGHYHACQQGRHEDCLWTMLGRCDNPEGGNYFEQIVLAG